MTALDARETAAARQPAEPRSAAEPRAAEPRSAASLEGRAPGRFDGARAAARDAGAWLGAVSEGARGRLGPVLGAITRLGWIVLIAGVVALVAGLVLGWVELVAVGGVLLVAMLAAIPFALGRTSYEVEIELSPRRVTVGDRALGRLGVRNAGDERVLPTRMEFPVGVGRAEFGIPALEPGQPHEELFAVPTSKRAVIPAGPAMSVRGDELGLLRRTVKWTGVIELFVHPRVIPLAPGAAGLLRDLEGIESTKLADADLAFHALRPYEAGDDRRHIHWRTSARTGQLMVRQFQETRKSQLTIVHSLNRELYAGEEEFELAISVAASLACQALRDDVDVELVNEAGRAPTRTRTALLDATSRFEPCDPTHPTVRGFVLEATRRLPPPSVVIVVAGSGLERAELRRIEALFPHEVQVLGYVCDVAKRASRTRSGDLMLCTIPRLEDLPKLAAA